MRRSAAASRRPGRPTAGKCRLRRAADAVGPRHRSPGHILERATWMRGTPGAALGARDAGLQARRPASNELRFLSRASRGADRRRTVPATVSNGVEKQPIQELPSASRPWGPARGAADRADLDNARAPLIRTRRGSDPPSTSSPRRCASSGPNPASSTRAPRAAACAGADGVCRSTSLGLLSLSFALAGIAARFVHWCSSSSAPRWPTPTADRGGRAGA
jgi:hypothetical protein